MEHDKGRGGQRAAQLYFRETGKPIAYRDDAGETHTFKAYTLLLLGGLAMVLALALPWRRQPGG